MLQSLVHLPVFYTAAPAGPHVAASGRAMLPSELPLSAAFRDFLRPLPPRAAAALKLLRADGEDLFRPAVVAAVAREAAEVQLRFYSVAARGCRDAGVREALAGATLPQRAPRLALPVTEPLRRLAARWVAHHAVACARLEAVPALAEFVRSVELQGMTHGRVEVAAARRAFVQDSQRA